MIDHVQPLECGGADSPTSCKGRRSPRERQRTTPNGIAAEAGHAAEGTVTAHENKSIFELVERFMSDQRVILRAVVMNVIEKAIQNGMSPEDVNDAIRPLLAYPRSEGEQN